MKNQADLKLVCPTQTTEAIQAKSEIEELLQLMSSMEISKIEEQLDEEIKIGELGKYFLLAALRDTFDQYKSFGDTQLIVESGTCKHNCFKGCNVYNLKGNVSNKNFAFVIKKENGKMNGIHFCGNFVNQNNENTPPDIDLYCNMMKKEDEFKKKDSSQWDSEKFRKMIEDVINIAYTLG